MNKLIEADAALEIISVMDCSPGTRIVAEHRIDALPAVDAVPVVRCQDCKHSYYASNRVPAEQSWVCWKKLADVKEDWFCADGERREGDGDG